MSKLSLLAAVAAMGLVGCGEGTPGVAGGEGTEVMSTVSALVVAPVGPGDREAEFVVDVRHDPGLDPEVAARLLSNIRVVKVPQFEGTQQNDLDEDRIWNGDVYWFEGEPFAVSVEVDPVDEELEDEMYRFEWIDHEVLFEHCPEGQHPFR